MKRFLYLLAGLLAGCAAARAAGDHAAQGGGAVGGGVLFYVLATMSGAAGWAAAGIAGIGGWVGSWFFTPKAAPGAAQSGFPWGALILGGAVFALVRAWAHYPAIFRRVLDLAKVSVRGFLGGKQAPPPGPVS